MEKALPLSTAQLHYLVAFDTACRVFLLVAFGTVDLLLPRDETLGTNRGPAHHAAEALLVPLPRLVLHLLRACRTNHSLNRLNLLAL